MIGRLRALCRRLHLAWLRCQLTHAQAAADAFALDAHPHSGRWLAVALLRGVALRKRLAMLEARA